MNINDFKRQKCISLLYSESIYEVRNSRASKQFRRSSSIFLPHDNQYFTNFKINELTHSSLPHSFQDKGRMKNTFLPGTNCNRARTCPNQNNFYLQPIDQKSVIQTYLAVKQAEKYNLHSGQPCVPLNIRASSTKLEIDRRLIQGTPSRTSTQLSMNFFL